MDRFLKLLGFPLDWLFNIGLATGLLLGALLVLRPLLKRIFSPRQRLILWMTAWLGAYFPAWYSILSWVHLLPVTLRDLITPRMMEGSYPIPKYLPSFQLEGLQNIALPGGGSIPICIEPWMTALASILFWGGMVLVVRQLDRGTKELKARALQGRLLDWHSPELEPYYSLKPEKSHVQVRLCQGLPTSFVYQKAEHFRDVRCDVIYLQEELPPQRRALVLRHELNHLRLHHPWMKGIMSVALALYWWNPLVWLGYRYSCLDLELDCDRATLEQLSPEQRQEYAKTLVELGSGQQLWDAPLAFGESDGAVRAKAAVSWNGRDFFPEDAWKQKNFWLWAVSWAVFLLVLLFFVGGPSDVVFPADVDAQIAEQFGGPEDFVRQDEHIQHVRRTVPESVSLLQGWRSFQDSRCFDMVYQLSDGRWGTSNWFSYSHGPWECMGWDYLTDVPDLAGYELYYPAQ